MKPQKELEAPGLVLGTGYCSRCQRHLLNPRSFLTNLHNLRCAMNGERSYLPFRLPHGGSPIKMRIAG